ncbi:glycoside hydrolase family 97 protein [Namhaeicola litoreus]|uniref:Glycoside hydrolase family 97 catalytic domain-containing protein n=1 Tax=Namhaeicola litoreus TaxID=1052145 RepID=A0ABW3Y3S4_9FLAO
MNKFKYTILIGFILTMISNSCSPVQKVDDHWPIQSPNGKITLVINHLNKLDSSLVYHIFMKSEKGLDTVLSNSSMGIERSDDSFTKGLKFISVSETIEIDETYESFAGKRSQIRNHAMGRTFTFETLNGNKIEIEVRVFDDATAFRYIFPEKNEKFHKVLSETTGFNFYKKGRAWMQPYDIVTKWTPAYEKYYESNVQIGEISPNPQGWCFPALFKTGANWVLLTEAGLYDDFYGARLHNSSSNLAYTIGLPEDTEANGIGVKEPQHTLPWKTPWRVIVLGDNLGAIVETDVVKNLSKPNEIENIDWIKPGRASWSWWSDHPSSKSYNSMKPFIDLAAEMGWEYTLIDANWNTMQDGSIEELVAYGNSKGVGSILWYNSGGPHNTVTEEPRDLMHDSVKRKEEFKKIAGWGVKGIKVDFFQSDKPFILQQYLDILKDAAAFKIMVNFHGATIPRGWERTYPNLMTMESVRGGECYSFASEYPERAPSHNTILPATRNVVGSMDYTPVTFSDNEFPHLTTNTHELALAVIFESGWQHMADRVESYRAQPDEVIQFLKDVPASWDETKYIQGIPGNEMVIARRKGNNWFIAGINGEKTQKDFLGDFSFLTGEYDATFFSDGKDSRTFSINKSNLNSSSKVDLKLSPLGGFVIHLKQK